jgi:chromosome segregation ATPase
VYEVPYLEVEWTIAELETNKIDMVPAPTDEKQKQIKDNAKLQQARYHSTFQAVQAAKKVKDDRQKESKAATKARVKAEKRLSVAATDLSLKQSALEAAKETEITKRTELEAAQAALAKAEVELAQAKELHATAKKTRQEVLGEYTKCNRELSEAKSAAKAKAGEMIRAQANHVEAPKRWRAVSGVYDQFSDSVR